MRAGYIMPPLMKGATAGANGRKGLVRKPVAGEHLHFLRGDGTWQTISGAGLGDCSGPTGATDNAVARFNGTGGKNIQNSGVIIDDSNNVTGVAELTVNSQAYLNGRLNVQNVADDTKIIFTRTGGKAFSFEHSVSEFYLYNRTDATLPLRVSNAGNVTVLGNLTVSGTGTHTFSGVVRGTQMYGLSAAAGTSGYFTDATNSTLFITHPSAGVMSFKNGSNATWLSESSTNVTLAGSLAVSGTTDRTTGVHSGAFTVSGGASVAKGLNVGLSSSDTYSFAAWGSGGTDLVGLGGGAFAKVQGFTAAFAASTLQLNPIGGAITTGSGAVTLGGHLTVSGGTITSTGVAAPVLVAQSQTDANYKATLQVVYSDTATTSIINKALTVFSSGTADGTKLYGGDGTLAQTIVGANTTIAGNLAVSGTGTHTFAGNAQVTNANDGIGFVMKSSSGTGSKGGIYWKTSADAEIWRISADPEANNSNRLVIRSAASGGIEALAFTAAGAATFGGSITTSAPTGGAGAWKLGIANAVTPTSPNRTITIEIGGTAYYLHAKTTND